MAPSPPRLRILSGEKNINPIYAPHQLHCCGSQLERLFAFSELPSYLSSIAHIPFYNQHELGAKEILCSWRQRSLRLFVLETSSNERLRCHSGLEGQLPGRRPVWNIVQVSLSYQPAVSKR